MFNWHFWWKNKNINDIRFSWKILIDLLFRKYIELKSKLVLCENYSNVIFLICNLKKYLIIPIFMQMRVWYQNIAVQGFFKSKIENITFQSFSRKINLDLWSICFLNSKSKRIFHRNLMSMIFLFFVR